MKKFMEALEEQQEQDKKQQKLHEKHNIADGNVVVVEKSNMIKFSLRGLSAIIRLVATCIIIILAIIGLMCIVYPETRRPLINIFGQTFNQLNNLTGSKFDDLTIQEAKFIRVVDGDTIEVPIDGINYSVRMIGINTPESVASKEYLEKTGKENSAEGKAASEYTKRLLKNQSNVFLQTDQSDTDIYGRLLRYVWLEKPDNIHDIHEISSKMVNAILLRDGYAEVSIYEPDTMYEDEFFEIVKNKL